MPLNAYLRLAALALTLVLPTEALHAADKRKRAAKKEPAIGAGVLVTLKEGREIAGAYMGRRDGAVWLEVDGGEVGIEEPTVLKISPAKNAIGEFLKRKASLDPKDSDGLLALAVWARERKLESSAVAAAEAALAANPHHGGARDFLGHRWMRGRWLTGEQAKGQEGLVEFEGRWIPWKEAQELRNARADDRLERERLAEQRRDAEISRRMSSEHDEPAPKKMGGTLETYVSPPKGTVR